MPDRPPASDPSVAARMSRQRRRDTEPELAVRRLLHARGLRYRVNLPVPGRPRRTIDIAFTRAKLAVFIDGCFWHSCPEHATAPAANDTWWHGKLERNRERDLDTNEFLADRGWQVVRFWEHESPIDVARAVEGLLRKDDSLRQTLRRDPLP